MKSNQYDNGSQQQQSSALASFQPFGFFCGVHCLFSFFASLSHSFIFHHKLSVTVAWMSLCGAGAHGWVARIASRWGCLCLGANW